MVGVLATMRTNRRGFSPQLRSTIRIKSPVIEVCMRYIGARIPPVVLFLPLLLGSWFTGGAASAEDANPVFRCDFSGRPKADPCEGPWSASDDRAVHAPLDQVILKAAWNDGLKLTFDLIVSANDSREQLAVAHAAEPAGARRLCLAEGGPSFKTETFDYLACRQGIDLGSGVERQGRQGDLYLDGAVRPYISSPRIIAPHGIREATGRDARWNESVEYKPSRGAVAFLVRDGKGGTFRVDVLDYTPAAALEKGVYAVVGLTFLYAPLKR